MLLTTFQYQHELLQPLSVVTTNMERHGIPFNVPAAQTLLARVKKELAETDWALIEWYSEVDAVGPEMPPNWGSWQQLQYFLYTPCGLDLPPALYWKKGATGWSFAEEDGWTEDYEGEGEFKTDDKALEWLAAHHPEHAAGLNLIRELRWKKRVVSYLETWIASALWRDDPDLVGVKGWWWLHPSFGLSNDNDERAGAVTGRFAVKNPALQQVPSRDDEYELRKLFEAPPGYSWVVVDYGQLEVVIMAHLCARLFGTHGLVDRVAPGQPDMHSLTTKYITGETLRDPEILLLDVADIKKKAPKKREINKSLRYGVAYCKGARSFGNTLFMEDGTALGEEQAQKMLDALFAFDPEIVEYQTWVRNFIQRYETIVSLLGRMCPLPDANSREKGLRNRAWRRACNYPMQAGGQEITAAAMIRVFADKVLAKLGFRLMLQVHDELCGLVRTENAQAAMERLTYIMLNTIMLEAYLGASGGWGPSWGMAKK